MLAKPTDASPGGTAQVRDEGASFVYSIVTAPATLQTQVPVLWERDTCLFC